MSAGDIYNTSGVIPLDGVSAKFLKAIREICWKELC
jgi:hypothetical protein